MSEVINAPAPAAAPAAAPVAAPAPPSIAWLPDAEPDTVGYVQNKGWQAPADALKAYQHLEKFVGADKAGRGLVLPLEDDEKAWGQVYDRLGRPATPADYKIGGEGDKAFSDMMAAEMHAAGLTVKQAQRLAAKYGEFGGAAAKAQQEAADAALAAEHAALAKEWGQGPESQVRREMARRAATKLGLDESAIDALEKVQGFSKTMRALAKIGDMFAESKAEGFDAPGSFGTTPEGARAERAAIMADPGKRSLAMNPNSATWQRLQQLDKIIAGA